MIINVLDIYFVEAKMRACAYLDRIRYWTWRGGQMIQQKSHCSPFREFHSYFLYLDAYPAHHSSWSKSTLQLKTILLDGSDYQSKIEIS